MDEHRSAGVNVKVYNPPRPGGLEKLSEEESDAIWERVAESFWIGLQGSAQSDGLAEQVYAEGRMGGWAVPDPAIPQGSPKWDKFVKLVEDELDYYVNTVWPEAVEAEVKRIDSERLREDPFIEIKLRRSAVATVAGLVAESKDWPNMGIENSDEINANNEIWEEIRKAFPWPLFVEFGDTFSKQEEKEGS